MRQGGAVYDWLLILLLRGAGQRCYDLSSGSDIMWLEEVPPPGGDTSPRRECQVDGKALPSRQKKEVFDAAFYALCQAVILIPGGDPYTGW